MSGTPIISVVIAAYRPGAAFERVIASLDAQTLAQESFETIVVDDGSPDDTFAMLTALAASRPNMRVERIENSGWPSRPRNVGTSIAAGEYVFFMDHDDSLYPDALRRMAEYAAETRADVLSPKESKTSDAWWGIPALRDGDIPDARVDGGIDRLLPMVPHKLYRRAFLQEHGIAFPEGRRQLWEDIYVNVEAWAHAQRVAVLADTPVYLWHSSATNSSKSYGPRSPEFWDRLDELFAFIDTTLGAPGLEDARRSALIHQFRGRVLLRLSRNLHRSSADETAMATARAREIQERYVPEGWDPLLGAQHRARAVLLRADRPDLLQALWTIDADTAAHVTAADVRWRDGVLHVALEAAWRNKAGEPVGLVRDGERLLRDLPDDLRDALPVEVRDLAVSLPLVDLVVGVRDRDASITWSLPVEQQASWTDLPDGRVGLAVTGSAVLDPGTAAAGAPLGDGPHDVIASLTWDGAERSTAVRRTGQAAPVVLRGRTAVAYPSKKGALALDTSGTLRNVIADGGTPSGAVRGSAAALRLPLPRVLVEAAAELPAAVRLTPEEGDGDPIVLPGRLLARGAEAALEAAGTRTVPDGSYLLGFALGEGRFVGARRAWVERGVLTIGTRGTPRSIPGARRLLRGLLRRVSS